MIDGFFNLLLSFIAELTTFLLIPIDALITQILPDIDSVLSTITNIFNVATDNISFIADMTLLPPFAIYTICDYIIFKITIKFSIFAIKLALSWYRALK